MRHEPVEHVKSSQWCRSHSTAPKLPDMLRYKDMVQLDLSKKPRQEHIQQKWEPRNGTRQRPGATLVLQALVGYKVCTHQIRQRQAISFSSDPSLTYPECIFVMDIIPTRRKMITVRWQPLFQPRKGFQLTQTKDPFGRNEDHSGIWHKLVFSF